MIKFYILLIVVFMQARAEAPGAIILDRGPGRLGDNLLHVAEGVWVAIQKNLPVYVEPFEYSDEFAFDTLLPKKNDPLISTYKKVVVKHINDVRPLVSEPTAYHLLFATPYSNELRTKATARAEDYGINWRDPQFLDEVKKLFQPVNEIPLIERPQGMPSIAVHVRTGGGFDKPHVVKLVPGKFTSVAWAIKKIKEIYNELGRKPVYVHIFTDSLDQGALLTFIKSGIGTADIQYGLSDMMDKKMAVMSDLLSMAQFDYLICAQSNFSFIAWLIGNHIRTYRQYETRFYNNQLFVMSEEIL